MAVHLTTTGVLYVIYPGNSGNIVYLPPKVRSPSSTSNFDQIVYVAFAGEGQVEFEGSWFYKWYPFIPVQLCRSRPIQGEDHHLRIQGI